MPRGGRRENAGKKSSWGSGRSFAETKVIRVPTEFADQLLGMAHKLDAGEQIDLVTNSGEFTQEEVIDLDTKSIQEENEKLKQEMDLLRQQLFQFVDEVKQLKAEKEFCSKHLELESVNPASALPTKEVLVKIRDRYLKRLSAGKQSKQYAQVREIFNDFIDTLLTGKY
jgi:hypothetical protein